MRWKDNDNLKAKSKTNAETKKELDRLFNAKAGVLRQSIANLPVDCAFRDQAQAVLDYVNRLKLLNKSSCFQYRTETLNEVLDKTMELIDPNTDPEQRMKLLGEYELYAKKLKWNGGLEILGGVMCLLAAAVCIALVVGAIIFLAHLGNPAILKAGPEFLLSFIFGMEAGSVLSGLSIVGAIKYITSGVKSRGLGNSLQGLFSEMSKGQTHYEVGMNYLEAGESKLALSYLSKVSENSPDYQKAQLMIASSTFAPTKESKPQDFSNLLLQVKALEGKEGEGKALPDVRMEDVELSPVIFAI